MSCVVERHVVSPLQIPSHSFPVKEMFNGSAAFSSLGVEGRREGSRNSEEIALMVFWQVCMDAC